jgi:hypothetical protein
MDVEAQVIGLVGEMDRAARERVVEYLHARYLPEPTKGAKVTRKARAAHVARAVEETEASGAVPVAQAAKLVRVQKARVYGWIKRGKLKTTPGKPYRNKRQSLVSVADVRALSRE